LERAAAVVVERGYEGLRYQDVSLATGVPVASLRHYFPTIDGLRNEALTQSIQDEMAMLRTATESVDDPWEQLCVFIRHSLGVDERSRRYSWLLWLEYWRSAARDPDLVWMTDQVNTAWAQLVQSIVQAGIRGGRFTIQGSVEDAAFDISAIIDGIGPQLVMDSANEEVAEHGFDRAITAVRRVLGVSETDCPDV